MMKNFPSARGIMFEMYVIQLFQSGDNKFIMRQLLDGTSTPATRKFTIKDPTTEYIRTATDLSGKGDGIIILPTSTNFGAADLFYTPDMIFQVTVSEYHPIKQAELVKIVENMPAYKKNNKAVIRLVFVVPDDIYNTYTYQDIVTKDEKSKSFRKVKKMNAKLITVQQWVLKIEMAKMGVLGKVKTLL